MTHKEAECFRALRHWQRVYFRRRFACALKPRIPFYRYIRKSNTLGKCVLLFLIVMLSPVFFALWLLNILRALLVLPFVLIGSYIKPPDLRPPGERNIKGVHYQFARHIDLPPDLYIQCVDDWVSILYGQTKLPQFSLAKYLDADYLMRRGMSYENDASLRELIKTQISNAREDLSRDLGHYY